MFPVMLDNSNSPSRQSFTLAIFLGCLAEDVLALHRHFLITTAMITSNNTPPAAEAPIMI